MSLEDIETICKKHFISSAAFGRFRWQRGERIAHCPAFETYGTAHRD